MATVNYKPRSRRPGCFSILLMLFIAVIAYLWLTADDKRGFFTRPFERAQRTHGQDAFPDLREVWAYGSGSNKVVRVPISGMIALHHNNGSLFHPGSTTDMALRAIRRATRDTAVKALILIIDSGGGGITASDILYKTLLDFKAAQPNRRIVALCGDTAASGAYYAALAADHIIAHPTTITGSIGVLIHSINLQKLAQKHGIKDVTIKSGKNKDLLNPLTDLTPEEHAMLQSVVNTLHDRFVGLVAQHRDLPEAEVRDLADGRIFTAGEALRHGLIDETGYWQDAMARTAKLLDVDSIIVYRYEDIFTVGSFLRAARNIHPRTWLSLPRSPRLQYRWQL